MLLETAQSGELAIQSVEKRFVLNGPNGPTLSRDLHCDKERAFGKLEPWEGREFVVIENLPWQEARVSSSKLQLVYKTLGDKQRRLDYARHIHGVIFRLVGEAFASLPSIATVTASGYSQIRSKATGNVEDQYLLSVRVPKSGWCENAFDCLEEIEPEASLARFDLQRKMTQTGVFKPIEPLA